MDLYAEGILEHYRHPRNAGRLPNPDATRHEMTAACGDQLTLDLSIRDGIIVDVRWTGQGCAISQASMSLLSETLIGMKTDAASSLRPQAIRDLLGVPVGTRRLKCAFLSLHALKNALKGNPQSWEETLKE